MLDIACVGIVVADVIAKPVDDMPEKGKLNTIDKISMHTGGCAVNTAVDLVKIGKKVSVLAKTGDDGFGTFLRKKLSEAGIDITGIKTTNNSGTSASVVLVDSSGERSFIHTLGANAEFEKSDIDWEVIKKSKILFIGGSMLMPKFDGEPCAEVLKKAKDMGKTTALDVAWDAEGRWMKVLRPCMEYIDYFMPSYEEAVELSGKEKPEEMADVFLSMGVKNVIIKLGKKGCYIKDNSLIEYYIPTFERIKAIDATGAGDSFVAGFLTGLSENWDIYDCGRFANAVGTFCVTAVGASSGIKSKEEILKFIDDYDLGKV
jgi:sugar/nucleoside kinase (ribokinase family)